VGNGRAFVDDRKEWEWLKVLPCQKSIYGIAMVVMSGSSDRSFSRIFGQLHNQPQPLPEARIERLIFERTQVS
jgi:hypothetical protein